MKKKLLFVLIIGLLFNSCTQSEFIIPDEQKNISNSCELTLMVHKEDAYRGSGEVCIKNINEELKIPDSVYLQSELDRFCKKKDVLIDDECKLSKFRNSNPFNFTIKTRNGKFVGDYINLIKFYLNGELIYLWNSNTATKETITIYGKSLVRDYAPEGAEFEMRIVPSYSNLDMKRIESNLENIITHNNLKKSVENWSEEIIKYLEQKDDNFKNTKEKFKDCKNKEKSENLMLDEFKKTYCDILSINTPLSEIKSNYENYKKEQKFNLLDYINEIMYVFYDLKTKTRIINHDLFEINKNFNVQNLENLKIHQEFDYEIKQYSEYYLILKNNKKESNDLTIINNSSFTEKKAFQKLYSNPAKESEEKTLNLTYYNPNHVYFLLPWNGAVYDSDENIRLNLGGENLIPFLDIVGLKFQKTWLFNLDFKIGLGIGLLKYTHEKKEYYNENLIFSVAFGKMRFGAAACIETNESSFILGIDLFEFFYEPFVSSFDFN